MQDQMLSITISNFRSIRSPITVPLTTNGGKVIGLYGPNASGKTNIIRAIGAMRSVILHSCDTDYELPYDPFLFSSKRGAPTAFEADFLCRGAVLRYGFAFTGIRICHEYLSLKSEKTDKYRLLFAREERRIINPAAINYGFGSKLLLRTRQDSLLLTKAYEDNNQFAVSIVEVLKNMVFASFGEATVEARAYEILLDNPSIKNIVVKQLSILEPSISDILIHRIKLPSSIYRGITYDDDRYLGKTMRLPAEVRIVRRYNDQIYLQRMEEESVGIRTLIATLSLFKFAEQNNSPIFIDEFGNYLHPRISAKLIDLYQASLAQKTLMISSHQLDLYTFIGRSERVIVTKDVKTGETTTKQKRTSVNPRRDREDLEEAEKYYGYNIGL